MNNYKEKQEKLARERKKRQENYIKKMKKRKAAMEAHKKMHS